MGHYWSEMRSEAEEERERAHELKKLEERRDALVAIQRGPGFGRPSDGWAEKEVAAHLEGALRLLDLMIAARRPRGG